MTYLHNIYTYLHKYAEGRWYEDIGRRRHSASQAERPQKNQLTRSWPWAYGSWNCEEKHFCCSTQYWSVVTVLWQSWWTPDLSMLQQALFEIRSLHKAGMRWEQVSWIVWETSWQPDWRPWSGGYAGDICMLGTGSLQFCEFRHPWVSPPTEDENLLPVLAWALPLCWACARCTEACLLPPSSSPLERAWYLFIGGTWRFMKKRECTL